MMRLSAMECTRARRPVGPCQKCGGTERKATRPSGKPGECKACSALRAAALHETRPEVARGYQAKYRDANRESTRAGSRARYHADREKGLARCRAWRLANPATNLASKRNSRTGWSGDAFDAAWSAQAGRCAICAREMVKGGTGAGTVAADHCHASGKTRGLLCKSCNMGLGHFKDDVQHLRAAAAYLERHR